MTLLATLFPYFEKIHSANELARLYIADAIVHDGTVAIDGAIRRHTHVPDKARRKGRTYSDKAPGITAAIIGPLWVLSVVDAQASLATKMRVARLFGATLPLLLLLFALSVFLARKRVRWRVRLAVVVALALASPLTVYGVLLFGHGLAATLVFCAFVGVDAIEANGSRRDLLRCFFVGACVGWAVAVEYPAAVFLVPAAVLYVVRVTARLGDDGAKTALLCVAASVAGAVPFVGGVLVYHQLAFGSPVATGYAFLVNKTFAKVHAQGFMGISWPQPAHFAQAFFAPNKGIFVFAPWFLLVIAPSLARMRRLPLATRRALWATLLLMVLFVSAMVFPGGGWTVSQRHLVPWLPFAAAAVAIGLSKNARMSDALLRVLFVGGALAGFAMCFTSLLVWPYLFDDLQSPVAQLIWPALLDGWRVPSTLSAAGLPSTAIAALALVALVVTGGIAIVLPPQAPARGTAVRGRLLAAAVALAALFVGAFVVTAPAQEKVVRKRRVRLERAYRLDPSATPVRLADKWEREKNATKATARKKLRANAKQKREAKARKRKAEERAAQSPEGTRVRVLLGGLRLSVDTGKKVVACKAKDRRGKIACPKFGAGVFVRRAFLHDDNIAALGADASAPKAHADASGVPRVALRAYLPREGGALVMEIDVAAAQAFGGFLLVSSEAGAPVSVVSEAGESVTLSEDAAPLAHVEWKKRSAFKRTLQVRLEADRGDRELFLIPLPPTKLEP